MCSITDIRCVLTQKALDTFCDKFYILEEVHPVLPNQNDTIHKRHAGKIRLYTRFFDYANFRLLLSTFLVDVLRHFRINISQLSVIGAAKNGWMSFSKRSDNAHHVTRDPDPVAADFNAQDYATLVAHPSLFRKFPEAFMCLKWIFFAFIHAPDPTKVKIVVRERNEGEPLLLETTIGRIVPLLSVVPDRAESELEASVDRLFDEGGSGNQTKQWDSAGDGKGADIQPVSEPADTVVEDVAPLQPRRQRKRKTVAVDAGESSHPPKRLREDHGTTSGASVGGKYMYAVQRLLAKAVLYAEVGVAAIPTLPFVTASVSTTLEHEVRDHTDFVVGPNLRTIGAPQRFVISSDSSHHSGANVAEAEVDSVVRSSAPIMTTVTTVTSTVDLALVAKEKPVKPSLFFADSSLAGDSIIQPLEFFRHILLAVNFLFAVSRLLKIVESDFYSSLNSFFVYVRRMEHDQLFTEFNVGAAHQMSLSAESLWDEVNALKERNTILEKKQSALDVKVLDLEASAMGKERELTDLNAQLTSIKSQNDNLADQVHELEISSSGHQEKLSGYEHLTERLEEFQDAQLKIVNDKVAKLDVDLAEMACHLEEKIYPHLLMTISSQRWLLTHGLKFVLVKCLNSSECLTALGAAISRAIKKGMQSGLATGIDHGKEGRSLADIAAYNPDAEADFNSVIQKFREVDFPLLAELKSHKDASMEDIMNLLRLEGALAGAPGMDEFQPDIEQLRVPIHRSEDHVMLSETSLLFALSVSQSRVEWIRENIAAQRSALLGVWTPLSEPLSISSLMGEASTSGVVPAASVVTTALSTTFASASSIPPISTDDYEIAGVNGREVARADGNATPFPNVDDVELNIL
ncbi:hypothetical protein Tco_0624634 [Tanacetum coccineum]|uniref:Transposase (Putative), gypsy type n=1 Tax=Tanacetum coccineum TaxID=301880 RepID=A0ABQ4WEH1_9ASTR